LYKYGKEEKIIMCEYKFKNTATTATKRPEMLDITGFSPVAVSKNSATGTATNLIIYIIYTIHVLCFWYIYVWIVLVHYANMYVPTTKEE
jgi:hypothetical protein